MGAGVHHLVKDTGEALGDIAYEAAHYEGDSSKEKIASRSLDVLLNVADATTLVAGGVGAAKGGASALASAARTVKAGTQALSAGGMVAAEGIVMGGARVVEAAATGTKTASTLGGPAAATVLMSTTAKGRGAPGSSSSKPAKGQASEVRANVEPKAAEKAPEHHIMTNKNRISKARGGPWTPRFEDMARRAGMTLDDAANRVRIPGHGGPHPEAYHEAVFDRLRTATRGLKGDAYSSMFKAELDAIRTESATPGTALNRLVVR